MELFPVHPDLSLQISPPNTNSTSSWTHDQQHHHHQHHDLGFWKRAMETSTATKANIIADCQSDLLVINQVSDQNSPMTSNSLHGNFPLHFNEQQHHQQQQQVLHHHPFLHEGFRREGSSMMNPIRGIPIYHASPNSFPFLRNNRQLHQLDQQQNSGDTPPIFPFQGLPRASPRFLPRFPPKRNMRAPRMRWTTMLHARFLHAVELLGGHERATPKSVLELMDVKDLTLAHVKSHLQMYRTLKTTDRAAASSGHTEPIEISDDSLMDANGSEASSEQRKNTCATASSAYSKPADWCRETLIRNFTSTNTLEDERSSKGTEPSSVSADLNPNLEFTLGRQY